MRRRSYLAACTGLTAAVAGCAGILESDDGSDDDLGPAETVEAYFEAARAGEVEEFRSYRHSEATLPELGDEEIRQARGSAVQLQETTVVERGDGQAIVEATLEEDDPAVGERAEGTVRYELRTEDGEWRIYDLSISAGPAAPQVQWDVYARSDDGAVTAVVFEHTSGDTVEATRLGAQVGDATAGPPADSADVTAGRRLVVPFDGDGDAHDPGSEVELRWSTPEWDGVQVLASYTLDSETAGSLADAITIDG